MKKIFVLAITVLLLPDVNGQTSRISFEAPKLYPEGVAWSEKSNCFFLSSVTTGTIGKLTKSGQYQAFYLDTSLKSTFGMKADDPDNILWVTVGDPNYSKFSTPMTFHKTARIIGIDLTTAQKKSDIDLSSLFPGDHFINDLALDNKGNIYVTDSYSPVIYKVSKDGKAGVFAKSDLFAGKDVALNGIAFHPDGFLLVSNDATGCLLKIDVNHPEQCSKVKMDGFFPGADGLLWDDNGRLIMVQNKGVDKIYQLTSKDGWSSAVVSASTTTEDRFQNPSTAAKSGHDIYILNAKLNELADSIKAPSREFSLQKAIFR